MIELAIDIETYSETNIKSGVHKYVEDDKFQTLMIAYKFSDEDKMYLVDLMTDQAEGDFDKFLYALTDSSVLKTAYNAAFEITCLSNSFNKKLDPKQWSCTMALAAQAGLPFGLDAVSKALKTVQKKDSVGKELIKYFTMPCKPTKANKMRTRNLPIHNFSKWLDFREYCKQDVITEQEVRQHLSWFTVPEFEKPVWALDQKINNTGVRIDKSLVGNAIAIEGITMAKLTAEMEALTNIANPKSPLQVKKFIEDSTGVDVASLNKAAMPEVLKTFENNEATTKVLKLREKLSRTSIKKYTAMVNSVCRDMKIRGLFQYYGANRTGRWAGRNVQLQNLKKNDLKDLDFAREMVRLNKLDVLELTYDDVGEVLSNLIRTSFIPSDGNMLVVSDFSAIEARIIAWLANETWRLEIFKTHGKIYEASAAMMAKIPIEEVDKNLRAKGKIAELALGYQGAVGAMERMGGSAMGLGVMEMQQIVNDWRRANPKIVKLWYSTQDAFIEVITTGKIINNKYCKFYTKNNNAIIELPSGRKLVYLDARYDGNSITYYGMDQVTKQWSRQDTYGGKLVENIVQAIARDILTNALLKVDAAGHKIIMHVHDEIVIDSYVDVSEEITAILSAPVSWAPGLPLAAETFTAQYYQK